MIRQLQSVVRTVRWRPRLFVTAAIGWVVGCTLPADVLGQSITRWLVAWNVFACLYIVLAAVMMARASLDYMRQHALTQDDGKYTILGLTVVSAITSLVSIAAELSAAKDLQGWTKSLHMALAGLTVLSAWGFVQIMFTLHYAHDYYLAVAEGARPGLRFPDDDDPDYGDFFYFAAVIGTSGQTADVSFVTKPMRRIGSLHCILAYLFNTTVLALLINIGAGVL